MFQPGTQVVITFTLPRFTAKFGQIVTVGKGFRPAGSLGITQKGTWYQRILDSQEIDLDPGPYKYVAHPIEWMRKLENPDTAHIEKETVHES